jgi:lipopolysaccharide biosynthesis regulator YciM
MITLLLLIFLLGVGLAWYLGFRMRPKEIISYKVNLPRDYLVGLNFLLNEETDKAVDVFIKMLEVDSNTVETHLAVGKLFRRRGEVDRAIRIHQNLIARPQLEKIYREQALLELGQDYLSAGVLDRAERIFLELVNTKVHAVPALRALIDIYQQEKEWEKAIHTTIKLENITKQNLQTNVAHYYCELAEMARGKGQQEFVNDYLTKALYANQRCVRTSLLQADVSLARGEYKNALHHLKQIKEQNPDYLSEAIEPMASCYEKLNQGEKLVSYLKKLLEEYPRVPVVLILAERIRQWKGDKVAANFVADYVRRYPTLRGLYLFVNLYISSAEGKAKEDLLILQNLMKKLLADKPDYQCTSCGFSGKTLHWHCPGCKQWSTVKPIYSLEGTVV